MQDRKKIYYSIGEVCSQTGLESHVLRYWESEFPQLRPKKNRAGNRAYREKDIDIINQIKRLLYEEQYSIAGAKKKLADSKENGIAEQMKIDFSGQTANELKKMVETELREILKIFNPPK